ncbi:MAG: serine protease [Acidobacteriota bacterium]|nr:serine protease [Acidobacteriota bacterium]
MTISVDLMEAKQLLSARLLNTGLQGNAVATIFTHSVSEAVASAKNNVHAVGVGKKIVDGKVTETPAVRIYVAQKIDPSLLSQADQLPKTVDGIPTDIIESPPAFFTPALPACTTKRQKRQRPMIGGISVAHKDVTAGTIAYFCRSVKPGDDPAKIYVLSNNHVLADVNKADIGDDIYQPGPLDGGTPPANKIAKFHRFVPINLDGQTSNKVDAAIAELLVGVASRRKICQIGKIIGIKQAEEDMEVRKHGRTTGFTEGIVTDESIDALVGMDHNNPNIVARFTNQMRIDRIDPHPTFGEGGDSGSLVVHRETGEAVGLYFAGPPSGIYGLANYIGDVITELEIQLL